MWRTASVYTQGDKFIGDFLEDYLNFCRNKFNVSCRLFEGNDFSQRERCFPLGIFHDPSCNLKWKNLIFPTSRQGDQDSFISLHISRHPTKEKQLWKWMTTPVIFIRYTSEKGCGHCFRTWFGIPGECVVHENYVSVSDVVIVCFCFCFFGCCFVLLLFPFFDFCRALHKE